MSTRRPAEPGARVAPASYVAPAGVAPAETGNRRACYRHRPRAGTSVVCRRLPAEGGSDLCVSLLDIAGGGVRLVLKGRLEEGDHLEVGIDRPGGLGPRWFLAYVVWTMPTTDGDSIVGARFLRWLTDADLRLFAQP